MTPTSSVAGESPRTLRCLASLLRPYSEQAVRYAMVGVFLWFGGLKFTSYEANAIAGLAVNSPLLVWLHNALGVQGFSNLIGLIELSAAFLLAINVLSARLAVVGGLIASGTFVITLSFMVTTPGVVDAAEGGLPYLSVMPGQFLLKDVVLLAVSLWLTLSSFENTSD